MLCMGSKERGLGVTGSLRWHVSTRTGRTTNPFALLQVETCPPLDAHTRAQPHACTCEPRRTAQCYLHGQRRDTDASNTKGRGSCSYPSVVVADDFQRLTLGPCRRNAHAVKEAARHNQRRYDDACRVQIGTGHIGTGHGIVQGRAKQRSCI